MYYYCNTYCVDGYGISYPFAWYINVVTLYYFCYSLESSYVDT